MKGYHEFELDAHYLSPFSRAFGVTLSVTYEVPIGWDPLDRSPTMGKIEPEWVTLMVGGVQAPEMAWSEMHGPLKQFIALESEKLGLEQLNINDEEAREELEAQADEAQFYRDHAAGRV